MASEEKRSSSLQDLWDRRFFQYLGTYLGLSFGLIQFADFLANRYALGTNLVDKVFIFLLALLPAMAVFIYNHGRKGHDEWRPFEKIFIPASLVLGLTLAVVMFNDSAAKAATEKISITNLDGASETRLVPKVEYTKRFAIFPFENRTGNADMDWMRMAMPYLLDKDMEQFMLNYGIQPFGMKGEYDNFNVEFPGDIPFSTQLKIAQEYYSDYLIIGRFEQGEDNRLKLSAEVHNTKNGQIFFEKEVEGEDIYDVVDLFSAALDEFIYLKDNLATLDVVDLPSSNLVTPNAAALRALVEGITIFRTDVRKVEDGIASLEKSVELDPNCGTCFAELSRMYFSASEEIKMAEASEMAVSLAEALPERQRFLINFYHYSTINEWEKGIKLLNNLVPAISQ